MPDHYGREMPRHEAMDELLSRRGMVVSPDERMMQLLDWLQSSEVQSWLGPLEGVSRGVGAMIEGGGLFDALEAARSQEFDATSEGTQRTASLTSEALIERGVHPILAAGAEFLVPDPMGATRLLDLLPLLSLLSRGGRAAARTAASIAGDSPPPSLFHRMVKVPGADPIDQSPIRMFRVEDPSGAGPVATGMRAGGAQVGPGAYWTTNPGEVRGYANMPEMRGSPSARAMEAHLAGVPGQILDATSDAVPDRQAILNLQNGIERKFGSGHPVTEVFQAYQRGEEPLSEVMKLVRSYEGPENYGTFLRESGIGAVLGTPDDFRNPYGAIEIFVADPSVVRPYQVDQAATFAQAQPPVRYSGGTPTIEWPRGSGGR
jgi:hypothetical protein